MSHAKEKILGYAVDSLSVRESIDTIFDVLQSPVEASQPLHWLACFNPHSYASARRDTHFAASLCDADWLVPDGAGVLLGSRVLGGSIRERVTGSDVFCSLLERMNESGGFRVFFLGGTNEVLISICERMQTDFPNVIVAGTYSPPFKPEYTDTELDEMIEAVNTAEVDVLWVGMTAPKQEKWIYQNRNRLNIKFAAAIGAVFDFYTGRIKRSHPFFQQLGLEWLPRLLQEPRRLWRRMLISAPIFLWDIIKERMGMWRI